MYLAKTRIRPAKKGVSPNILVLRFPPWSSGGVIPFFLPPPSPGHKGVMVWCQEQRKKKKEKKGEIPHACQILHRVDQSAKSHSEE